MAFARKEFEKTLEAAGAWAVQKDRSRPLVN